MAIRWWRRSTFALRGPRRQPGFPWPGCLLFCAVVAPAQVDDHTAAGVAGRLLMVQPAALDSAIAACDTHRTPRASFEVGYHDILRQTLTDARGSVRSSTTAGAPYFRYDASGRQPAWGWYASWTRSSVSVDWCDRDDGYRLSTVSGLHGVQVAGWRDFGRFVHAGARVDGSLRQYGNDAGRNGPAGFLDNPRLGYGAFAGGGVPALSGAIQADRRAVHSSLTTLENTSSGGHADLPLVLTLREVGARIGTRLPWAEARARGCLWQLVSDTASWAVAPGLKSTVDAQGAWAELEARAPSAPLAPGLQVLYSRLRARAGGYDGEAPYALLGTAVGSRVHGELALHLPRNTEAGIFGDYGSVDSGAGHIDLFPFSSWTLFDPHYYRMVEAPGEYAEYGCFGRGRIGFLSRHAVSLFLDVSRLTFRGHVTVKERSIVYLIPTYGPEERYAWDDDLLVFKLGLEYSVRIAGMLFTPGVRQILPVELDNRGGAGGGGGDGGNRRSTRGGTSYRLAVEMAF